MSQSEAEGPAACLVHDASLGRAVKGLAARVGENQRRRHVVLNAWEFRRFLQRGEDFRVGFGWLEGSCCAGLGENAHTLLLICGCIHCLKVLARLALKVLRAH